MDTQRAIEKLLQGFTRELMKVFSEAMVRSVGQVMTGQGRVVASATAAPALQTPARRGRPKKAVPAKPERRPAAPATPKAKPGKVLKSTPDQVNKLADRIVETLRRSDRNLTAKELMEKLQVRLSDEGRFQYALNKLKEGGDVAQHGERRMARYGVGSGAAAKTASPRGGKSKSKSAPTAVVIESAASESPSPAEG